MSSKLCAGSTPTLKKSGWQKLWINFKKNWMLHLMILIPLIHVLVFQYAPLYGVQIAFRDFRTRKGIWGSEWVWFENFEKFFSNWKWPIYVKNTLTISLYSLAVGFPIPIFLALILHINESKVLKKLTQNVSYIPHFISIVVMIGIINAVFNPFSGIWNYVQGLLGLNIKTDIRSNPDAFYHLYVWSGVWQNMGWNAIIYVSALSAVPMELHEAAKIDGASRLRRVWAVDLPAIMPTIVIMLIMRFGSIMAVGYEKVYLMQTDLNINKSEVISTYVYKYGLSKNNLSYGSAVGLMNSLISTGMVVLVNWIANKLSDGEQGLF